MSFSERGGEFQLRVSPNAAKNELVGCSEGVWRVKVAAPPVRGKANQELIAFLAQKLGLSKGDLTILKGHTSRSKVLAVRGLTQEELSRRLSAG